MNEKKGFSKTEPFRLGPHKISLEVLIGAAEIDRLEKKFQQINSTELWICLREVVRFIYLCGHSPSSLFFPGDQLVDDVWHALIIETESYKTLCAKLNAGTFIHHSGVKFEDYVQEKGDKRVHEEQVSWLASYLHNFGPIEPEAFKHLTLGSSIATQLETDLAGVNQWAESLIQLSQFQNQSALPSSIDKYVEEQVKPHSALIAENPRVLIQKLKDLLKITSSREVNLLSSQELEKVFEGSVSLGFTLWQHLAAVERLSGLKGWQEENQSIWKKLAAGQTLCGLATTHLANPKGSPIKGTPVENGYKIQGSASWVCGCDLFEKLLIGFSTSDTVVFALIDFPHFLDPSKKGVEISMNEMDILAGTSTVRLSFSDFFVSQAEWSALEDSPRKICRVRPSI